MDYPSSEPGAAFVFVGDDSQSQSQFQSPSPWDDPTFSHLSLESLFLPGPDHRLDVVADPGANSVLGPRSCASQAVRAPPFNAGIEVTPIPFRFAGTGWPVPATVGNGVPVPPETLSNIARQGAANLVRRRRSSAQSQRAYVPTQHLPVGTYPAGPSSFANWELGFVSLGHNAAYSPSRPPDSPADPGSLPSPGLLGGTSLNALLPLSPAVAQWIRTQANYDLAPSPIESSRFLLPPVNLNTGFDSPNALSNDGGLGSSSIGCNPSSQYALSPSPGNHDALSGTHRQLGPKLSPDVTVPGSAVSYFPSPSPQRSRAVTKSPETPLAIVQYKPSGNTEETRSKKRPALEEVTPQGIASQTLRHVSMEDENGQVQGTMMTFGERTKRRAVFTKEKRQQTARARKEGVCGRCKNSKRQCDLAQQESLYVSCTTCTHTRLYKRAARNPCFKSTLADILFFRSGPASNEPFFTQRRAVYDLGDVARPNVSTRRTLELTQHIGSHHLVVYASEFTPSFGDVVSYKWQDLSGTPQELRMPDFCLADMKKVEDHLRQYIESAKWSYLESLRSENELAWMTVSMAIKYAKGRPNSLVAEALSLWAISRIIEIPWEMCGTDTLGVSLINDANSPHHGKIPIPPIMDTQLDQIVIKQILNPLRQRVVQKFEQLITPAKPEVWFEVYLSAFILLNHIERLAKHSASHAKRHTMPTKYSNIPFLEGVFHTAKSILARFHFVCNGSAPLKLDWKSPKTVAMAKLDPNQVEFMKKTQTMIAARESDVLSLRATHQYEQPLYWAGQLFSENFDTSPVHVVEEPDGIAVKIEA